ncbi:MAG: hypothetical protein ACHQHO_06485 [Solirubrobacterales bacterium]
MRTISVRLSRAEHRLLADLAGARGVSVETLVREAMALAPFGAQEVATPRLQIVRSDGADEATDRSDDAPGAGR